MCGSILTIGKVGKNAIVMYTYFTEKTCLDPHPDPDPDPEAVFENPDPLDPDQDLNLHQNPVDPHH